MIYIHNVVSSSCHININAFLKKSILQTDSVIYIVQFDMGQKKTAKHKLKCECKKNDT